MSRPLSAAGGGGTADRPRVLILSFSPIASDARVLKQVELLRPDYAVTTCAIGDFRRDGVEHIRIPDGLPARELDGRLVTFRLYRAAYRRIGAVRWCRKALTGRRFDIVLADDVEAVPVALELRPSFGVHADLHEYTPGLHDDNPAWVQRIQPFWEWVCRRYVSRAVSWTTVGEGIAQEFARRFGFRPEVVPNAAPYAKRPVGPVASPLRLVHSGAGLRNRKLEIMIEGVLRATTPVTLDLYLTANDPSYIAELRDLAAVSDRVHVQDPVPYARLADTIARYDVGVFILPPTTFNYRWALPNKLFDFVQARLGVIVGPSPEMARVVREHGIGRVAEDFTPGALADTIDGLTTDDVRRFKTRSDAAALELSAEALSMPWLRAMRALMTRKAGRR